MTSLHRAAESGDVLAVREAVRREPEAVHGVTKGYNETPLHRAAVNGHDTVVAELVSAGADVNAERSGGFTPLHLAETVRVAETLLLAGADQNARSSAGKTPAEHCAGGAAVQQYIANYVPAPAPTPTPAPPVDAPANPVDERRRTIEELEQRKTVAVAAERYEEAGELKAQIALLNHEIMEHLASSKIFAEKCTADANQLKKDGNARFKKKDWLGAMEKYSAAIAIDATVPAYFTNRSVCLLKLKRWEEAKKDGLAAAALAPADGYVKGFLRAAQACIGMDDYTGMRGYLDDAAADKICDPSINLSLDTPELCCEAAECALRCELYVDALAEADKAIAVSKEEQLPLAHVIKADALVAQQDYMSAMKVYEAAMMAGLRSGTSPACSAG